MQLFKYLSEAEENLSEAEENSLRTITVNLQAVNNSKNERTQFKNHSAL